MRNIFILILMFACLGSVSQAFCAKDHNKIHKNRHHVKKNKKMQGIKEQIALLRYEIDAFENGKNKDNIHKLDSWIQQLETKIVSKMQHAEARLEKYKNNTNETEERGDVTETNAEKIRSSENKIQVCQELLNVLDQLKAKLNKR